MSENKEKCIICENADELLKALNEHPKAILHLSKRQIRRLGRELAKAYFDNIVDGFNRHKGNGFFMMNKDGSISLKKGYSFKVYDIVKEMESTVVAQTIRELNPVLESTVAESVSAWLDKGGANILVAESVAKAMKDCASKLIEAALQTGSEVKNEQEVS